MDEANYNSVVDNMRTSDGLMYGLPVVLDTADESVQPGQKVLLQYQGKDLAVMEVESKFLPNKPKEAKMCYGTSSLEHPGVQMIAMERGKYYIGGKIHGTNIYDTRCAQESKSRACRVLVLWMLRRWGGSSRCCCECVVSLAILSRLVDRS